MGPLLLSMVRETVLWPSLAALAMMAAGALLQNRLFNALAIGTGFLVGYALIYGNFSFPPTEAQGWLPVFVASAFIVFAIDDLKGFPFASRLALQGLFSTAGAMLLLLPLLKTDFPANLAELVASILLWFGLWILVDMRQGPALFFVSVGNAAVCATTGSTMLGQLGGVLATVLGIHLALNLKRPPVHAGSAVATTILASLMLIGHAYAGTSTLPTLLLLAAFAGLAFKRPVFAWSFSLLPVAISIALAVKHYLSQDGGGY